MIYNEFSLNICLHCGNEEIDSNAIFCKICGSSLANKCAGKTKTTASGDTHYIIYPCETVADKNARFCIKCGCTTTYFESGQLICWEDEMEVKKGLTFEEIFPEEEIPF